MANIEKILNALRQAGLACHLFDRVGRAKVIHFEDHRLGAVWAGNVPPVHRHLYRFHIGNNIRAAAIEQLRCKVNCHLFPSAQVGELVRAVLKKRSNIDKKQSWDTKMMGN